MMIGQLWFSCGDMGPSMAGWPTKATTRSIKSKPGLCAAVWLNG